MKGSVAEKKDVSKKKKIQSQPQISGLLDIISPTDIRFHNKSIVVGELYQRVIVITDYPPKVDEAWLSRIVTEPGVIASIHANPKDPYDLISQIKVTMGELGAKIARPLNEIEKQRAIDQMEDAKYLVQKIDREAQKVFNIAIVIVISADEPELLEQRTRRVNSILAGAGMRARAPMFRQEEAYRSASPFRILEKEIADIANRNMPVETIAASYPFVYSGLNDGQGILLGTDKSGGIVLIDFWKREGSRTNTNITILGRPGVGKSTTVKKLIINEFAQGTKFIVIDPNREYKDLCKALKGDWIDCGKGGKGVINPFQVRDVPLDEEDEDLEDDTMDSLYTSELKKMGPLALHFQTLRTFYSLYLKDLTDIEKGLLEIAFEEIYKEKGIFFHTTTEEMKKITVWPTQEDLYNYIEEQKEKGIDPEWRGLSLKIRTLAKGADQYLWNGQTTVRSDSDFICLDIRNLLNSDASIMRAQFFNILGWAWNKVTEDRTQKYIIVVDESYLLVDPDNIQPLVFMRNTSKQIRKFEGGLWVISHNMIDFMDNSVKRFGQALIDNPVYKIIMGQGDEDIDALVKLMSLSDMEKETLLNAGRGDALLVAGNRRLFVKVKVADFELDLIGQAGGR